MVVRGEQLETSSLEIIAEPAARWAGGRCKYMNTLILLTSKRRNIQIIGGWLTFSEFLQFYKTQFSSAGSD